MKSLRRVVIIGAIVIAVGGAVAAWRQATTVQVDVSTFHAGAAIELAAVRDARVTGNEQWFSVTPGVQRLAKGAYYFRLNMPDRVKVGLVALDEAGPVVLK